MQRSENSSDYKKGSDAMVSTSCIAATMRIHTLTAQTVASRLIATLERLLGMAGSTDNDLVILSALELLQGMLLLHPPSRTLFSREIYLNILLDLLDSANPPPSNHKHSSC